MHDMKLLRALCLATSVILGGCEDKPKSAGEDTPKSAGDPNYPLKVCVVSGEKLGSMGAPYIHNHEGKEVQFCCKGCIKDFNKEPEKYLAKITSAPTNAKP